MPISQPIEVIVSAPYTPKRRSRIIAIANQKGGVGKSTISRAIATTYAKAGWNVKVADLDINQSTSFTWLQRRLANGIEPVVAVETFGTVAHALRTADAYDLMVMDGAPPGVSTGTAAIRWFSVLSPIMYR